MIKNFFYFLVLVFLLGCSTNSDSDPQITINVSDFNISIPENPSNNQELGTLNASVSSGSLQFSIISQTPAGAVSIDAQTGVLKVVNATLFDFEINPIISGTIKVSQGNLIENATFQIQVDDVEEGLVFDGSIQITTQQQVNDFGAENYTVVTGSLEIFESKFQTSDIYDLSPLKSLTHVYRLYINGIPASSLEGLNNLKTVDFVINLVDLPNLENLHALSNLESIGVGLFLNKLPILTNLNGLEQLTHIGSVLDISYNNTLVNLDGLSGLSTFDDYSGESTISIYIIDNPILTSLEGLSNIQTPIEKLMIRENDSLINLNGLESISGTLNELFLSNLNLKDLSALANVTSIDYLNITGCYSLTSLDQLAQLSSISQLHLSNNPILGDIDVICNASPNLYSLTLEEMPLLEDLTCFQNIKTVPGNIFLSNNSSLTSLQGLESLLQVGGSFFILYNPALSDFCALTALTQNNGVGGSFVVSSNAFNPDLGDIEEGNCSL